jgi:Kef-type K+ transport system membrane component KefB
MSDITHIHLPFFAMLLILIVLAKMLGEIMERLGQPSMIGEIIAGVILGPSVLHLVTASSELKIISDLGVFLLVVLAGLEINIEDIVNAVRGRNAWIAIMGFIIPLLSGLLTGYFFHLDQSLVLFLGLCIAITALPVSIRILMDLGKLETNIGKKIISAAIFNDVVSLLVLGIILDFKTNSKSYFELFQSISLTTVKFLVFSAVFIIAYKFIKKSSKRISIINKKFDFFLSFMKGKESLFAIVMVFVLIFASITELVGLHFVIGAFFGSILLSREILGEEHFLEVKKTTSGITMGLLAPIFFAMIGVQFDFLSINNLGLLLIILGASFLSKIFGGYAGGRLSGMNHNESMTLGLGLNARGIMELVIANIALINGFIDISFFSILVIMGITTTIVSPFLLKWSFARMEQHQTAT